MFLDNGKNQILSAGLIFTFVTAEIGPYALDKFHIPHLDTHNHPREAVPQTFSLRNMFAVGTSASTVAITDVFYQVEQ